MSEKNGRKLPENECSQLRWIIIFVLSMVLTMLVSGPVMEIIKRITPDAVLCNPSGQYLFALLPFFFAFWITVCLIKTIGGTSFKSFVLGNEQISHRKETCRLIGLYFIGLFISTLLKIDKIAPTDLPSETVWLNIVIGLLFIWFQTTSEELWFRGLFIRFAFGNHLKRGFSTGSVILVLISSVTFTAAHLLNPEVLLATGIDAIFSGLSYTISGLMLIVIDLYTGTLEAGIALHWVNNLFTFLVVSPKVSAGGQTSLFIDLTAENTGRMAFLTAIMTWIPIMIYMVIKSKNASRHSQ